MTEQLKTPQELREALKLPTWVIEAACEEQVDEEILRLTLQLEQWHARKAELYAERRFGMRQSGRLQVRPK